MEPLKQSDRNYVKNRTSQYSLRTSLPKKVPLDTTWKGPVKRKASENDVQQPLKKIASSKSFKQNVLMTSKIGLGIKKDSSNIESNRPTGSKDVKGKIPTKATAGSNLVQGSAVSKESTGGVRKALTVLNHSVSTAIAPSTKAGKVKTSVNAVSTVNHKKSIVPTTRARVSNIPKPELPTSRPVTRKKTANRESVTSSDVEKTLYYSASEDLTSDGSGGKIASSTKVATRLRTSVKRLIPDGIEDFDLAKNHDLGSVSDYAFDIFEYLKSRERFFMISDYLNKKSGVTSAMRTILVDWFVEVQEMYELFHETLYLAVKLLDMFLSKATVSSTQLQLVGCACLLLASKYEERNPPAATDFLDISDRKYSLQELIIMQIKVLEKANFNLGFPLSYRFLRRYARCSATDMKALTLARYILELSLLESMFISVSDSKLASAALYLARLMCGLPNPWNLTLHYYSGYQIDDFKDLAVALNKMLNKKPLDKTGTIHYKYSHEIFYNVALIPRLTTLNFS